MTGAVAPDIAFPVMHAGDEELGPNADEVERFMARLQRLPDGALLRLAAFGDRASDPEHRAVYAAIGRRVDAAGRKPAIEGGRDLLTRWVSWRGEIALPGYIVSVDDLTSDARRQALPAAYDAMVAFVARDLLRPDEFEFLTEPWREVAGDDPARVARP